MKTEKKRVLSIGAHPDDADTSTAGLLGKLYNNGWEVRLLSVTDGSAGTFDISNGGEKLAHIRKKEAAESGKLVEGSYDVWDIPDGKLQATIENRERLIRYIRNFSPDLLITNRSNDYHPDHRNTATLVNDASYLLTVPYICSDTKAMSKMPVILYWEDEFERPYPFKNDIIVPIDNYLHLRTEMATCHESQYFDWLYYPDCKEKLTWSREKQIEDLATRYGRTAQARAEESFTYLANRYSVNAAKNINAVEYYEISELGAPVSSELRETLEKL